MWARARDVGGRRLRRRGKHRSVPPAAPSSKNGGEKSRLSASGKRQHACSARLEEGKRREGKGGVGKAPSKWGKIHHIEGHGEGTRGARRAYSRGVSPQCLTMVRAKRNRTRKKEKCIPKLNSKTPHHSLHISAYTYGEKRTHPGFALFAYFLGPKPCQIGRLWRCSNRSPVFVGDRRLSKVARRTVILRFHTKIAFSTSGGRKHANNNSCPRFLTESPRKKEGKNGEERGRTQPVLFAN